MKTPHKHPEILKAFIEDTSVKIERLIDGLNWCNSYIEEVTGYPDGLYRIKPAMRSITLADGTVVSWPEPMRVAPAVGSIYWVQDCFSGVSRIKWNGDGADYVALKAGFCHLTEEAAQQHRKALVLANGGEL